jgi:P4 family phage/plasmid primase-like protien
MTTSQPSLEQFLRSHANKNKKDAHRITHTRIPDKDNNIYGGSYIIEGEDEIILHDLIYKHCIQGTKMEYLTEVRQGSSGAMAVDLDFRYAEDVASRQHDDEWTSEIIYAYLEVLKDYLKFDKPFNIYIMEKPTVNRQPTLTKDGIHIIFAINVPYKIQMEVRNRMLVEAEDIINKLPLINTPEAVFDKGISTGKTNWQLLGCRKPCCDAYKVVGVIKAELDNTDGNWMTHDATVEGVPLTKEQYMEASARANHPELVPTSMGLKIMNPENVINKPRQVFTGGDGFNDVVELMRLLKPERGISGNYDQWRNIGMVVKNTLGDEGKPVFQEWTNLYCSSTRCNEFDSQWNAWHSDRNTGLQIGSLHMWARDDSPAEYNIKFPVQNKILLNNTTEDDFRYAIQSQTHDAYAKLFNTINKGLYKCVDMKNKIYYEFSDAKALWIKNESGSNIRLNIGNEFKQKFVEHASKVAVELGQAEDKETVEQLDEELTTTNSIIKTLESQGQKNNILAAISDAIHDTEFLRDMNKKEYILPIKNKQVIDLRTLEKSERNQSYKFDYECDVDYRELTDRESDTIREYFESLFCGNKETTQVVLNILKSVFTGKTLRYIFFVTGSGRNGKSVLFNILRSIFNKSMDIISNDVIIQKKSNSHLNTEVEKLDRCRLGYVTELKETDKLNETLIKKITGGDPINVRGIQKTDDTLIPTTNLFVPTNELPEFDVEQAICDRIIIIPFNNKFEINSEFEKIMIEKKEQVFCYIMKHGVIQDKFDITDDMRMAKQEYIETNVKDYLGDFINDKCEFTDRVKRDDFRAAYNEWCRQKGYKKDSCTDTAFTKKMKLRGFENQRSASKVYYTGIKLIEEKEEDKVEETDF